MGRLILRIDDSSLITISSKIISLRPHHLVCLQNFEGKGYDNDFVLNLSATLAYLQTHINEKIISIVSGADDVCQKCPKNINGKCADNISTLDTAYLDLLELPLNSKISFQEIKEKTSVYLTKEFFDKTCKKCQWYNICSKRLGFN